MRIKYFLKTVLAAAAMVLLHIIFSTGDVNGPGLLLGFAGDLMILLILGYYILHSSLRGILLFMATFLIYFGVAYFNTLNESWIFNVTGRTETVDILVRGFVLVLIIVPFFIYLLNPWTFEPAKLKFTNRPAASWIWRIALADLLYVVVYFAAGLTLMKVYPQFMAFYTERAMPSPGLVFGTQVFRGLVYAGVAIIMVRSCHASRHKKALLTGLVFSVLGGIAPLIQPNEFMPFYVRMGHLFEVGISNFLYGLAIGYLLGQESLREEPDAP